ncbi:MAG: hypothetical protein BWY24_00297 [Microgenomates group bacterium ADurb.Bin219]|nr:MAG: hypothetical protein BWY24_00297 [Microgenomates group bacterium ADurb.Bin219]
MEKIKLEIAKIVGTPGSSSWAQIHTFTPEEKEKLNLRGELLAVIGLRSVEAGMETVALGREILSRLHEEYFGNLEGGALPRLKSSLEKIHEEWPEVEIVSGVLFSSTKAESLGARVLYLAILGKGRVVVKRDNLLNQVLKGSAEDKIETASGLVYPGDIFLLGTESFFEIVSPGVLRASLNLSEPQAMVEAIAPLVLSRTDLNQAAAVINLLVKEKEEEIAFEETEKLPEGEAPAGKISIKDRFANLGQKIFLSKFRPRFGQIRLGKKEPSFYVKNEKEKGNRLIFSVAVILIILFLSSLFLGFNKRKQAEKENRIREYYSRAEILYNQAKEAVDLDNEAAVNYLKEAEGLLAEAKKIKPGQFEDLDHLFQEINNLAVKAGREKDLGELPVFFDLQLIVPEAKADGIALLPEKIAALNKEKNSVYFVDLEKKSTITVTDEKLKSSEVIFSSAKEVFVLTAQGLWQIDYENKKVNSVFGSDQDLQNIIGGATFAGNFYFLDQERKNIWQYGKTETGFSGPKRWAAEDAFEGKSLISFAVDGSIWVFSDKGIEKFIRGQSDNFSLKGIKPEKIAGFNLFFSGETNNYLYFVNSSEKKVLLFSKDGQLKAQYLWQGKLDQPRFLAVSAEDKKVYFGQDNLIFTFPVASLE